MKKLIASGEALPASKQLTAACSDCPLRRDALAGWLGGYTPVMVSTENLVQNQPIKWLAKQYNQVLAQRDELLAVLKDARSDLAANAEVFVQTAKNPASGLIDDPQDILVAEADQDLLNRIDAAITKAEGAPT